MAENASIAYITQEKWCDFCFDEPAEYFFFTTSHKWSLGCSDHYRLFRMHPTLGVGRGQKLVTRA